MSYVRRLLSGVLLMLFLSTFCCNNYTEAAQSNSKYGEFTTIISEGKDKFKILRVREYVDGNRIDNHLYTTTIGEKITFDAIEDGKEYPFRLTQSFNDRLYIPYGNKVYVIDNSKVEEYVELYSDSKDVAKQVKSMAFSSIGDIYTINDETLYKVNGNKTVESINIKDIIAEDMVDKSNVFHDILSNELGEIYAVVNSGDGNESKYYLYKINDIDNIELCKDVLLEIDGNEVYPAYYITSQDKNIICVFEKESSYEFYRYKDGKLDKITEAEKESSLNINVSLMEGITFAEDKNSFILLHAGEIYIIDIDKEKMHKYEDIKSFITSVVLNGENLYLGTLGDGVYRVNYERIEEVLNKERQETSDK